jgi:hypothetical protein
MVLLRMAFITSQAPAPDQKFIYIDTNSMDLWSVNYYNYCHS